MPVSDKVAVDLSGAAQTMLTTLYLKALDSDFNRPVLGDRFAKEAISRIDYDWAELGIDAGWAPLVTVRTALYDIWVAQFLNVHPEATVVHLGCGLDSRVFRIDPGPAVNWYDVDYPAVIALREQIYPARSGYRLIPTSAVDLTWLDQIPTDRPVLLVAEGISMYLTRDDGLALLRRVVDGFESGEIQIDFYNWFGIRSQKMHTLNKRSGSTLYWAVNSPADVLDHVPGLRLLTAVPFFDAPTFRRAPARFRVAGRLVRAVPPVRRTLQYHRYAFGPVS
jgi:O-methyltransferase involved in polyketide biosynthesis